MKTIHQRHNQIRDDCLQRIKMLQATLERLEKAVRDDFGTVNELGELQAAPAMLDVRVGTLATLRRILSDESEYCKECRVEEHDVCSMTDGCPCCDETKQKELEGT